MKYLVIIILFSTFVFVGCSNSQIDINSATVNDLDKIVWVGETTATKIIEGRPFESLEDLDNIYGIGDKKLRDIIDEGLACVENEKINNVQKNESRQRDVIPKFSDVNNSYPKEILPILLEGEKENDILVYESKNSTVLNYLPYAFSVFLILIIAVLILQRF